MHFTPPARFFILLLAVLLSACSSSANPIMQTMQNVFESNEGVTHLKLNPDFRYLRVVNDSRIAFLALGNKDADALGTIEVWYSAEREVMRLQNGRLVGAAGLTTEWRSVTLPALPSWSTISRFVQPFRWTRLRDVMPGYHFGTRDDLVLRRIAAPAKNELQALAPDKLSWFEERLDPDANSRDSSKAPDEILPRARYAVDFSNGKESVVYAEQCLAPELCFSWQVWPPAQHDSSNSVAQNQ